ncbi:MAG: EscE/YscE/SsaE family type III secretion system needle protein co-chaperone [Geminicoccaceae bacterium]
MTEEKRYLFALEEELAKDSSGELRDKMIDDFAELEQELNRRLRKGADRQIYTKLEASSQAVAACRVVIEKLWRKIHVEIV